MHSFQKTKTFIKHTSESTKQQQQQQQQQQNKEDTPDLSTFAKRTICLSVRRLDRRQRAIETSEVQRVAHRWNSCPSCLVKYSHC